MRKDTVGMLLIGVVETAIGKALECLGKKIITHRIIPCAPKASKWYQS
jgi:hypothetical protein